MFISNLNEIILGNKIIGLVNHIHITVKKGGVKNG
jgi:hypothetical protein